MNASWSRSPARIHLNDSRFFDVPTSITCRRSRNSFAEERILLRGLCRLGRPSRSRGDLIVEVLQPFSRGMQAKTIRLLGLLLATMRDDFFAADQIRDESARIWPRTRPGRPPALTTRIGGAPRCRQAAVTGSMLKGMDHDNVRDPYPAALSFRLLARQLDERDRTGGGCGTAQADRAEHGPHERC